MKDRDLTRDCIIVSSLSYIKDNLTVIGNTNYSIRFIPTYLVSKTTRNGVYQLQMSHIGGRQRMNKKNL